MSDSVQIKIVVKVGEETHVVEHRGPLQLGGDRRKWRKRIVDHVTEQTEHIASRFALTPADTRST